MNTCCFLCNAKSGLTLRNATNFFIDQSALRSGKKILDILQEVVEIPIKEGNVHSNIICKKCHNVCTDYDSIQVNLNQIKTNMVKQFKSTLESLNVKYCTNKTEVSDPTPAQNKVIGKKIVLPASKLLPIPPDMLVRVNRLAALSKANITSPFKMAPTTSMVNLKVTVGESVFTQNVTTTVAQLTNQTGVPFKREFENFAKIKSIETIESKNALNFSSTLPNELFSTSISKDSNTEKHIKVETIDKHEMEIDDECVSIIARSPDNLVFEVTEEDSNTDGNVSKSPQYLDVSVLSDDADGQDKFILQKLHLVCQDDDDDEGDAEQTLVLDSSSGLQLVYSGMSDKAQDSNDESQLELQVSGDEETANAIIAAAQEQGGAFIKVESGEMYQVHSVQSKPRETEDLAARVVVSEAGGFRCLMCPTEEDSDAATIWTADKVMDHLKSEHDIKIYICKVCGQVMRKRADYTAHVATHSLERKAKPTKGKTYPCNICNKTYTSCTLLNEHRNTHRGLRPHACARCNKAFASKYTLHAHLKTHADRPRPFKCSHCGKSFLTQQNRKQHERTHSGVKNFVCTVCNKAFGTQHNLEVHGVVHSGAKPFVCSTCGKGFARRAEVRDHMRIHTGERPYACEVCGASFSQRSNLHSHRRATHLGDKRYSCELCPKRFKRRRLLDYHVKSAHTGERSLVCEICHATFVYPEHYKKHLRIHTGERPYECEICGKTFNSRDNRNAHRFVHSDKKPYECLTCAAGFMRKHLLYTHMQSTGHIAESIVVNQPRVTKVSDIDTTSDIVNIQLLSDKSNLIHETILKKSELEVDNTEDSTVGVAEHATLDLVPTEGTIITLENMDGEVLEGIDVAQLTDGAQIVTNEDGGVMRLIQIKLPDGNNRWVAIGNPPIKF